jgi:6-phosphofructokinase 1
MQEHDFTIEKLGPCTIKSPVKLSKSSDDFMANYVLDEDRIIYNLSLTHVPQTCSYSPADTLEKAGPREMIFFDPSWLRAAIVTCGGLCPGLNDVIRAIVMALWHGYGVRTIYGIKYGYRGLLPNLQVPPIELTPEKVMNIHRQGGTMLGSSRGGGSRTAEMVEMLARMNVNTLFTIGGDGTQHAADTIAVEAKQRGMKLSVIGVPKTIDNDFSFVERSFGFETAVECAVQAVSAAHVEAHGAVDGIGLVKVMGRESGFIAVHTALGMNDVNFLLIPEVPFDMDGPKGFLTCLEKRLDARGHAVILAAEGAGQELMGQNNGVDQSGNKKLLDIGTFLKQEITAYFKSKNREVGLRYIDPSYMIRSAPATANDALYCLRLGTNAVHAAMSGRTRMIIGMLHNEMVHIPMSLAISRRNKIDPESALWRDALDATGQPALMKNQTVSGVSV